MPLQATKLRKPFQSKCLALAAHCTFLLDLRVTPRTAVRTIVYFTSKLEGLPAHIATLCTFHRPFTVPS